MKKIIFILFLLCSGQGFSADDESGAGNGKGKGDSNVSSIFQNKTNVLELNLGGESKETVLGEIEAFKLRRKLTDVLHNVFDLEKISALQSSEDEARRSLSLDSKPTEVSNESLPRPHVIYQQLQDSKPTEVSNEALPSPHDIYQQLLDQGITHDEVEKYSLVKLRASVYLFVAWKKEAEQNDPSKERGDMTALLYKQIQALNLKMPIILELNISMNQPEMMDYELRALGYDPIEIKNYFDILNNELQKNKNIVDIDFKNNPRNPANEILTEWFGDSIAEDLDKLEVLKKYYSMDDIRSLQSSEAEAARRLIVNENTGHSSKSSKILQFYYAYIDKGLDHDDISTYGLISLAAIVDLFIQLDQRHQNHSLDKQGYKDLRDTIMYVDVTIREFVESGEERFLEYAGVNSPRLLESIVDYRGVKAADRKQEIDRLAAEISQGGSCNSFF